MKPLVSMRAALADPALLGVVMGGGSRLAWRAVLIAAMGEAMDDEERTVFYRLTGRYDLPLERIDELWGIVGRRGGKSSAIAALAVYISCLCAHDANLSVGERGVCLVLASNAKQAAIVLGYVAGIIESVPTLAALVVNKTSEVISLSNGIDIEIRAASFRGIRGITAIVVIADEIGYWFSDETSRNPDSEILAAIRPALATTGGPLIAIGSPYARRGEMWKTYKKDFGTNGDPKILVVKGASRDLNPTLPQKIVDRALDRDEASARSEYLAEFRSDIAAYLSRELIEAAVDDGVVVRPPVPGVRYKGFADPSGGASDSFTCAIAHRENDTAILDCLIEITPPFNPTEATNDIAATLRAYGLHSVVGDRYAAGWVVDAFRRAGVEYKHSDIDRSAIYQNCLPLFASGRVRLLNNRKLVAQFTGLERKTLSGGRERIDHSDIANAHDDLSNSCAGALVLASGVLRDPHAFDIETFIKAFS